MNDVLFVANRHISLGQISLTILKNRKTDTIVARREGRFAATMKFIYEKLRTHLLGKEELG
jgi:hypothetical protein